MMPWKKTLCGIKQRCLNKKSASYYRYGGRGIKVNITADELKVLWFRDKAYLMDTPSIHRIDNDGNYEFGNCMYVERDDNVRLIPKKSHCVNGHPLSGDNLKTRIGRNHKGTFVQNECATCARQMCKNWRSVLKNRLHQKEYIRAWRQRRRQKRLVTSTTPLEKE